jgi:hypothetical protein
MIKKLNKTPTVIAKGELNYEIIIDGDGNKKLNSKTQFNTSHLLFAYAIVEQDLKGKKENIEKNKKEAAKEIGSENVERHIGKINRTIKTINHFFTIILDEI